MRNNNEIIFYIEESEEGGYVARALGHSIFTDGESEDDLKANIKDAVLCHFEESAMPKIITLHFVREEAIAL